MSYWLQDYSLSPIGLLESKRKRIENYKKTLNKRKEKRFLEIYEKASKDVGFFSKRDLFLAGLFLYWGEGTKKQDSMVTLTNTNPAMLKFFIKWLSLFNIKKKDLKVKVHLYSDMDITKTLDFWGKELKIPLSQFYKPYIKKTKIVSVKYKTGFGKGTCSVIIGNKPLWEYILACLKYFEDVNEHHFRP